MRKVITSVWLLMCVAGFAAQPFQTINGARFESRFPVAPGAYAQTYGNFAGVAQTFAQSVPLPTELAGVRMTVDGLPAPLYAVSAAAISFVVPLQTRTGRVQARITRDGAELASFGMDVLDVSPGIFHVIEDPFKQGGILNENNQYAVQSTPARRNQVIQIFATGQGAALSAAVADGAVPSGLVRTQETPEVFISVDKAEVIFSGLSPQFPGLWQINARVPDKPYIRGQVPVYVTINGVSSNVVSFWVADQ